MRNATAGAASYEAAKRRKITALTALLLILAVIWGRVMFNGGNAPRPSKADPSKEKFSADNGTAVAKPDQPPKDAVQIEWPSALARDPFTYDQSFYTSALPAVDITPVDNRDNITKRLKLQVIIFGEDSKALINGKTVRVGEVIDGALIKAIEQHRVIIEVNGSIIELSM